MPSLPLAAAWLGAEEGEVSFPGGTVVRYGNVQASGQEEKGRLCLGSRPAAAGAGSGSGAGRSPCVSGPAGRLPSFLTTFSI